MIRIWFNFQKNIELEAWKYYSFCFEHSSFQSMTSFGDLSKLNNFGEFFVIIIQKF